jgi:hypothetical protein
MLLQVGHIPSYLYDFGFPLVQRRQLHFASQLLLWYQKSSGRPGWQKRTRPACDPKRGAEPHVKTPWSSDQRAARDEADWSG